MNFPLDFSRHLDHQVVPFIVIKINSSRLSGQLGLPHKLLVCLLKKVQKVYPEADERSSVKLEIFWLAADQPFV